MNVKLIAHTPDPERLLASAARLCYSASDINSLMESMDDEKVASFVDMLAEIGHESPIEHITFTFGIEGVSRALLAQLTRHRIASYSVQSQRYVAENHFEYVLPPEIAAIPEAAEEFRAAMEEDQRHYESLTATLMAQYVAQGMGEKAAQKKAIEDARFVLPNACTTKIMMTMNARSLLNFFRHRCCNRAQWEIRELAEKMLLCCREVAPHVFAKAGPPCVRGGCPEGKMTCGQAAEMRRRYGQV